MFSEAKVVVVAEVVQNNRPVKDAPVAQLDRASAYEAEGREFESPRAHHSTRVQTGHMGDTLYRLHG